MKYTILFAAILLLSCGTTLKIQTGYQAEGFQITALSQAKVKLLVSSNVNVDEFQKSFESEYKTSESFRTIISKQIADSVTNLIPTMKLSFGERQDIDLVLGGQSYSDERNNRIKVLFESAQEDYFLLIKSVLITNKKTSTPGTFMYTGQGTGMYAGGGTQETCIVNIAVEVWSVKERRKVSEFVAVGKSTVFMFFYGTTLVDAVNNSVTNLVGYIRDNNTM